MDVEGTVPVQIGDTTYRAAPLNFDALERFGDFIQGLGEKGIRVTDLRIIRQLIEASIRRNEKDQPEGFLSDKLDMRNVKDVLAAVLIASGVQKAEADATGEQKPAALNGQRPTGGVPASI